MTPVRLSKESTRCRTLQSQGPDTSAKPQRGKRIAGILCLVASPAPIWLANAIGRQLPTSTDGRAAGWASAMAIASVVVSLALVLVGIVLLVTSGRRRPAAPVGIPQSVRPAVLSPPAVVCPSCGSENPAGHRFCDRCGKPLPSADVRICPSCRAGNPSAYSSCDRCGARL